MTPEQEKAHAEMKRLLAVADYDADPFTIDGHTLAPEAVIAVLDPYLTDARRARLDAVLAGRTYTVATVVEGLVNTGNVSAVMRSAEALGFQPFHIITADAPFKRSARTTQGADKWLDVHRWPSPADCAAYLKAAGYQIVATHLDDTAAPIDALDFTEKTALVFGNELNGVSDELLALSDRRCIIPSPGFTQSFNISVAAALALYHAYRDRLTRQGHHGDLAPETHAALKARFVYRAVRHAERLLARAVREG